MSQPAAPRMLSLTRAHRTAWAITGMSAVLACGPSDTRPAAHVARPDTAAAAPPATLVSVPTFGKAYPVDEAPRDADFAAFRDSVLRIIARRDTTALLAILAPEIKSSFGGDDGIAGFRTHWRLSEPNTELWTVLQDVLERGGRFSGPDHFYAPYTFDALPDSLDPFDHLIVRDSAVVVRERPDVASTALAILSFDIVRAGPEAADPAWRAIALADGRVGYVEARAIRSPIDYRAGFERRAGRWWLVVLVAGD